MFTQTVKDSVVLYGPSDGPDDMMKLIERVGRCCTGSQDKASDESHLKFVAGRLRDGHLSIFEHRRLVVANFDLVAKGATPEQQARLIATAPGGRYLNVRIVGRALELEGNVHAWHDFFEDRNIPYSTRQSYANLILGVDGGAYAPLFPGLPFLAQTQPSGKVAPSECLTVEFDLQRSIFDEFARHRVAVTGRSTRWCAENKKIPIVSPSATYGWTGWSPRNVAKRMIFWCATEFAALSYKLLRWLGAQSQQARDVLPLTLGTRLYLTFTRIELNRFLRLRTPKNAHPQARRLAFMLIAAIRQNADFSEWLDEDLQRLPER